MRLKGINKSVPLPFALLPIHWNHFSSLRTFPLNLISFTMMRIGGHSGGNLPPHDPESERQMANSIVLGNALTFGLIVVAINVLPHILDPMGFEVLN